ncbi:MAG: DUF3393 domain-containing protein [Helicobacteraceae bacterium]|nr:DUF3393 domain-containing protein [Candidatus Sulfurimonas ponti]
MLKHSVFYLFSLSLLNADSFLDAKKEFEAYKASQNISFESYQKEHLNAIKEYRRDLNTIWDEPKITTQNNLISYTPDQKTRTNIDFKNEEIIIETLALSEKEAKEKLKTALAKAVILDTKSAFKNDSLEQKLSTIKKPATMETSKINPQAILTPIIFPQRPTKKTIKQYVNKHIQYKNMKVAKSTKIKHSRIYTTRIKMPPQSIIKRSKIYHKTVKKESLRQKVPMPLVFAIIHSESSFNPLAKSPTPAFGLMQIVPKTAGRDAYKYLYNKDSLVSGEYLYNSENNIKMGTAYLHILYYRYLKSIKNEDSRLYCTIAAYNTGAGNVAWAFTKNADVKSASRVINTMKPQAVYNYLLRHLKYDEPKHYLKQVRSRMPIYHKLYGV